MIKKVFHNGQFKDITDFIYRNHGFSPELKEEKEYKNYKQAMEEIKSFDGLKVTINFTAEIDFLSGSGTKKGKIKVVDNRIRFYEGRKTSRFYYLDAGLYNGFYATLIPMSILHEV